VNILLDHPLALEVLLSHAAMCRADRREYKVLNARSFCSVSDIFSLLDLAFETHVWQPEILDTKGTVYVFERGIEFSAILHVTIKNFRAKRSQFLRSGLIDIPRERPHLPAVCQKFSCDRAALLTCCAGNGNHFIVHIHFPFNL
jgi:hypothetical protein